MIEKLGVIGGGQLVQMMIPPAHRLGIEVKVLETQKDEVLPAVREGASLIDGSIKDPEKIAELTDWSDVTTIEIEHTDADALQDRQEKYGDVIHWYPETLALINDKLIQKQWLRSNGIPVADFSETVEDENEFAFPGEGYIIKSRKGGFDGRGNKRVELLFPGIMQTPEMEEQFKGAPVYAEQVFSFEKELAVIAARDVNGNVKLYPVVETEHEDGICNIVTSPADISPRLARNAEELARDVLALMHGAGVIAIEMFAKGDDVIVNEIAPRVHNSGHHTLDSNATSQFEQHVRAVSGLPLGDTTQRPGAAVMVNILGTQTGPLDLTGLDEALKLPDTHVHLYGKSPLLARKIGHITSYIAFETGVTDNYARIVARNNATKARNALTNL